MSAPNFLTRRYSGKFVRDVLIFYVATLVYFTVGIITTLGLGWYASINTPAWTLPTTVIAVIWGILFVTTVMSLVLYCDAELDDRRFNKSALLYMGNALLIVLWNYSFFGIHNLIVAVWVAVAVGLTVLVLFLRVRRASSLAAWLLAPYLAWVVYAVAINYSVMFMN